jgi:hypothetical protein
MLPFSATPSIYEQGQRYLRFPHEPHENEFIPFRVIPFDSWAEKYFALHRGLWLT